MNAITCPNTTRLANQHRGNGCPVRRCHCARLKFRGLEDFSRLHAARDKITGDLPAISPV